MLNLRSRALFPAVILMLVGASGCLGEIRALDCERFFIAPNQPAVLKWQAAPPATIAKPKYIIADYWGREVAAGECAASPDGGIEVDVKLPPGFYGITLPQLDQRSGVVALPEHAGPVDPFFCMDSALSWLEKREDVRDGLARVLHHVGIGQSRERLHWGALNTAKDKWDWEAGCRSETLRHTYAQHGIKVLEMFHDAPRWLGRTDDNPYPTDLLAAAASIGEFGQRWGSTWGGLEIWNEPDIQFGNNLPADQYVPIAKAAAWACRNSQPNVPLVGGVLTDIAPDEYRRACAENGLLDHIDTLSFHTYQSAMTVQDMVGRYRAWLKGYGKESMPLYITESGRPWPKGPPRPAMKEDGISALDIVMKAIEAKACGVASYFAFVYVYFEENQHNFGMMGKDVSPLRSMAAYAQMVAALSNKPYVGDLKCSDPAVKRARVFGNADGRVAVLFTAEVSPQTRIKLGVHVQRIEGIDGRSLAVGSDGTIPIPDGLTYVWIDPGADSEVIVKDTPAARLYAMSRQAPPSRPAPSSIILRHRFDASSAAFTCKGYNVSADVAEHFPLRLTVHNLGDTGEKVALTPSMTGAARAVTIEAKNLELAPRSSAEVAWEVDVSQGGLDDRPLTLRVAAKGQGVPWISPLSLDLLVERTVAAHLARFAIKMPLPIAQPDAWQQNIVGGGRMTMSTTQAGGWRLEVHFGSQDRWVYPKLKLGDGVRWDQAKYLLLRAKCEQPASIRFIAWEDGQAGYLSRSPLFPANGQWHVVLIPLADIEPLGSAPDANHHLDADQVHVLSLGMNSESADNALEISDAYLVGE